MIAILGITIVAAVFFGFCYRPVQRLARGKNTVVEYDEEYEGKIGFSLFAAFLVAAFLVRIVAAVLYKGYDVDINCFLAWADMVFENGVGKFYSLDAFTDYPPGYMYVLYVIGAIRAVFGIAQSSAASIILTKLPAILCDMVTGCLVYRIASERMKERSAAYLAGIFLITPAVLLDSAVWAQVDSVFTLFVVLMCYFVTKKKLIPAYFVFAIGILIKPQTLIFTPVLLFGIVDVIFLDAYRKMERSQFVRLFLKHLGLGLLAIAMIALLMAPFGFRDALAQYTETLGSYPYASVNAYNFWTMIGKNWASQTDTLLGIPYTVWGTIGIVATVLITAVMHFKSKERSSIYYFDAAFLVTGVFTLSVRMHERYVYPAIVLLLLAYAARPRKKLFWAYICVSTVCFCNMIHSMLYYDPENFDEMEPFPIFVGILVVATLIYLVYLAKTLYFDAGSNEQEQAEIERETGQIWAKHPLKKKENCIRPTKKLAKLLKIDFVIMAVISVLYAVVAFVNLGEMQAPETSYSFVEQGEVVLDFGESVQIAKLWDFLGYANNPKYVVSYSDDQVNWQDAFSAEDAWDAGSVFCWNSTDTGISGRYVRIQANTDVSEDSMLELVFADAQGDTLLPVNAEDYEALFDEQELFEGRATNLNGTYFDEIYHARTAYEMIHHLYNYENTHPPLGKAIIAVGILIFGMNPFGWRFMGTLFGVFMLPILYAFAKKLSGETWIATVATLLFAFDFMHFAQTRIATIDVFVTLFIMVAYYFMFCYTQKSFYDSTLKDTFIPLGLCGVVMGISWASKWTGIYASAGLCALFFLQMAQRFREYMYAANHQQQETDGISHQYILEHFHEKFFKTIGFCCIFFLAVPAVIYTLAYIPMSDGTENGLIQRMLDNQSTMYNYHSTLDATHPYSSRWYEWPTMIRPIWFYSGTVSDTVKEGISSFGNPLVWWVGIPAFLMICYLAVCYRDKRAAFLGIGYLSQYLPWIFIGRCTFIYHYFPSVPFVVLMIIYCVQVFTDWKPVLRKAVYVYTGLTGVLFVMFYPVLSGMPVSVAYVQRFLKWFSGWVLI